jgi:capsular polysaccharide biosynthesis protein
VTHDGAEVAPRRVEQAEQSAAGGDVDRARQLLAELVGVVDAGSEARWIRRCVDVATRIDAPDLALHYALCLWCARPGQPTGRRAVSGAALFHPDRRVSGAGYRVGLDRARASDWQVIAAADAYAAWPRVAEVCADGVGGPRTVPELRDAGRMRPLGPDGTGAWAVTGARVTRTGKSLAIGVGDGASGGRPAYVPALGVWDPSAALRWDQPPTEACGRLGVLATRYSFGGYWHWLFEGLAHVVRLDDLGLLASLDRLVICVDQTPPPRAVHESLERTGIASSRVTVTSTPFDGVADELVVPMRAPGSGGLIDETDVRSTLREAKVRNARYGNHGDIREVRRRLGLDGSRGARGTRRLFVSRRDAAKRRVVNEDALTFALRGLGFEVVVPGALSFSEQVEAFSEAEIVVGPHGAGLANALFMPEGSAMLELHHPDFGKPYYRRLAATLDIHYRGLACEPAPTSAVDMVAAVDQATEMVRQLLTQIKYV